MLIKILDIAALILASCIVMILHELPKTVLFFHTEKRKHPFREILRLYQYIDPIGLLFCVTGYSGFSKGYMIRAKGKKANFLLGMTGFFTLLLTSIAGVVLYRYTFGLITDDINAGNSFELFRVLFPVLLSKYLAIISAGMFLVNLFPIAPFNLGMVIGGVSTEKYFSVLKNDFVIKMIFILTVILGIIRFLSVNIIMFFVGGVS